MSRKQKNNERKKEIVKSQGRCKIVIMCISLIILLITLFVIVIVRHKIKTNIEILARLENENAGSNLIDVYAEWGKAVSGRYDDGILSAIGTRDGGTIVGGYYGSKSIDLGDGVVLTKKDRGANSDGMIIKYNASGKVEWGVTVGGEAWDDQITCIAETQDGGYIVGGHFKSATIDLGNGVILTDKENNKNSWVGMIIKYNASGKVEWAKTVEGSIPVIYGIIATKDGGYIAVGASPNLTLENGVVLEGNGSNDGMIIKYNASGKVEWRKLVGGLKHDYINFITETEDGGFVVGGTTGSSSIDLGNGVVLNNNGGSIGMIIKYSGDGEVEWEKLVGGSVSCIAETKDGGYVVGGNFTSSSIDLGNGVVLKNNGVQNGMIIKYNASGKAEWGQSVGGVNAEWIKDIVETKDGGYVVGGYSSSSTIDLGNGVVLKNNGGQNGMIFKYNASGKAEWGKCVGEQMYCMAETIDGGYVIGGRFSRESIDVGNGIVITNNSSIQMERMCDSGIVIKMKEVRDTIPPTVTVSPTSGAYAKTRSITITVADEGGTELSSSNSYQYYLSTSSTALSGGAWTNYTPGKAITLGSGKTGTYYLFIKRVKDNGENESEGGTLTTISNVKYHRFGTYKFDNTAPTAGTLTMKLGSSTGSAYTNNTWTNQSVYIAPVNGADGQSGHKTTTYSVSGAATLTNQTAATTLTAIGTYTVTVTTTDNVGNTATRTYTIKIDKTKPTAGTLTMKLGSSTGSVYTNNTWTNQSVYIAPVNGADGQSGHKTTRYSVSGGKTLTNQTTATTLTATGTYTVTVTTTDNAGNTATSSTYTIKIDKTNPTAGTLTMKLDSSTGTAYSNNTWTNKSVYIAPVNGSDAQSGHKTTTYSVSGGKTLTNQTAATTLTATGTYTVTVKTTDNVGNTSTSSTYTIKIDKTNPTAGTLTMKLGNNTGSAYTNNTWTNQSVYIVPVNGSDAQSGHKTTTYSVSGGKTLTNQTTATTLTATGTYTVTMTTTDNVGNTATRAYTIKIDKTNPTAGTLTMKLGSNTGSAYTNNTWTNQSVYIVPVNGSDAQSGHKTTTYSVSGGKTLTNQTTATTLTETGTYTVTVKTTDNVGNTATSSIYTIKIDKTVPTITVNPTNGTVAKSKNVTITVGETGGAGLNSNNSYQYYLSTSGTALEGGAWTNYTSGTAFTIGAGKTGTFYLFVKRIGDNAGNIATTGGTATTIQNVVYQRFGTYIFDNSRPTVTFTVNGSTEYKKVQSTIVTVTDVGGAGIKSNTLKYQWTQSVTEPADNTFSSTFSSGGKIEKAGVTGTDWYLWILAEDNLGNKAKVRTNAFYLDNERPKITKSELINSVVKIEANDKDNNEVERSGVYKYRYLTSNTKIENPEITKENSIEVGATGEIRISNIDTIKYIYMQVEDKAGNTSTIVEIPVPALNAQGEVNLAAGNGKGGVNLSWELGGQGERTYKIYQKEGNEWIEIQTTEQTNLIVDTSNDIAEPNAPQIQIKGISEDNKINVSQTATDNGSTYRFYVEAYDKTDNNIKLSTSGEIEKEIKTGVKGYYYKIENIGREKNESNGTYVEGNEIKIGLENNGKTIKMRAVDVAGNIGEESSILINIPSKVTINPNGGTLEGSNETKEIEGLVGKTIELGTPTKEGHTFIGWEATAGTVEGTQYTYAKEEGEVTAKWQINEYNYQIEYYYEGIKNNEETITQKANYGSVIREYEDKVKEGYRLEKTESLPLTITTEEENNVIKVYYIKRNDLSYKVNYLEKGTDKVINTQKVAGNQVFESVIKAEDEVITIDGYNYDSPDKEQIIISKTEENNVINLYYTKRTDLSYTVKYLEKDTEKEIKTAKVVRDQIFESVITAESEVIEIEGYKYINSNKESLTITATESNNVINMYYVVDEEQTKELRYTVEYYKGGEKVEKDTQTETKIVQILNPNTIKVDKTKINLENKYIAYELDEERTGEIPETVETGTIIKVYYIHNENKTGYKIEYYYNGECDITKTEEIEVRKGETITKEDIEEKIEKNKTEGYRLFTVLNTPLKAEESVDNIEKNIIKVHYVTKETIDPENPDAEVEKKTGYQIEYYYDNKKDNRKTEVIETKIGETITRQTLREKIENNKEEGYKFVKVLNEPLEISTNVDNNIVKIHYVKNEVNIVDPENPDAVDKTKEIKTAYTIEYYYDNQKDNRLTDLEIVKLGTIITKETINEKISQNTKEGYKFVEVQNIPLETNEDIDNNVLKIHYVSNNVNIIDPENPDKVDPDREIKTAYTIEYYYDNKKDNRRTEIEVVTIRTTITKEMINEKVVQNTKEGYKFIEALNVPLKTEEDIHNNVIKIHYKTETEEPVDPNEEEIGYIIEYYYNGTRNNTLTEIKEAKINSVITEETIQEQVEKNKTEDYISVTVLNTPLTISKEIERNVIKVYYVVTPKETDNKKYKIEYYYDNEKDDEKTEEIKDIKGNVITERTIEEKIKNNEEEGYKLSKIENTPLVIEENEENNTIKIYYIKRTDLSYRVEYYYEGEKEEDKTENIENQTYKAEISTYTDKVKEGYRLEKTENLPLTITTEEANNVIKVYYIKRNDLSYKVNYLEKGTNNKIKETKIVENQIFESTITTVGEIVEIEGYNYNSIDKESLTITVNDNEINIYYTKREDLSYTVNYLERDTDKVLRTQKVENNQVFGKVVTAESEVIEIEGYKYNRSNIESIKIGTEPSENVINLYYTKREDLSYKVNYLEKGTNNKIKETKIVENQIFESTITTVGEIIEIEGYNYNCIDKESLKITASDNEINIYYTKRNDLKYTVNYLEKNTDKILSQQKVETNQEFKTEIIASDEIITIEGYKYDSADKERITIQVDEEQNIITIYYTKRKDLKYTVNYLEKGTNNKIKETKIVENQIFESTITTLGEIIEIDGYNYDSCDKEQIIITTIEENNVIKLYYTKRNDLKYTINYLEEDTDKILHTPKVENDQIFEKVVTAESEVIEIEGYEYTSCDKETLTIGTDETQNTINIYYIKRSDLKYTVNYLEEGTNKVIKEQKIAEGQVFEGIIEASTEIIKIEGYNYVHSDKENITIQVDEKQNEINLYYTKRTDIKYKVEYYYNGEKDEEETEEYEATFQEIIDSYEDKIREGYMLLEVKGSPLEIQTKEEQNVIKVYYAKITQVTVKYLNKVTNEVIEEKTEKGYVGKEFVTEAKDFKNYILVEEPEEKTIIMEEEEIIVKYYYKYISKGVIEKHIDVDSGEILYNATYEGNEGDEYKTEPKEFEHYEFVEERYPENAEGKMGKEVITVNYYYKKIEPITITVKYIDKETNGEIEEKEEITDYEGTEYKTEQKEIEGYEFIEVVGETEGVITEEKEIIYYYKKVKQPEPEKPGEGGDDPSTNKPSIDEEQKQPQTPDQTTTNKEIPSAGLTKEQIAIIVVTVMIAIAGGLVVIGIKCIKLDKKH